MTDVLAEFTPFVIVAALAQPLCVVAFLSYIARWNQ